MARKGPETRLVGRVKSALLAGFPGSFWFKVHGGPFQQAGLPDLIGCVQGRFLALEVKHPDQSHPVSAIQQEILRLLTEAGAVAAVVESVDEATATVTQAVQDHDT